MIATWIGRSLAPYRKYAVFSGRSDVAEYVAFCTLQLLTLLAVVIAAPSEVVGSEKSPDPPPGWFVAFALFWLASVSPWFALVARRFHDQGRSGKLAWLALAPWIALGFGAPAVAILLWLGLFIWLAVPGQRTENDYGLPQLAAAEWETPATIPEPVHDAGSPPPIAEGSNFLGRSFGSRGEAMRAQRRLDQKEGRVETPQSVEDGAVVRQGSDGRFRAKDYTFTTRQQAEAYLARERRRRLSSSDQVSSSGSAQTLTDGPAGATSTVSIPPAPTTRTHNSAGQAPKASPGIHLAGDGRYRVKGYSFATLQQAEAFRARTQNPGLPPGTHRLPIDDRGRLLPPPPSPPVPVPMRRAVQLAPSRKPTIERWITGPESVEIAGQNLTLELTYFGKAKDRHAWPSHNSLIDPTLPVANEGTWEDLGYWPSYAQMHQRQRHTYINWLASGRCDPTIQIGFVFVYFYGLERRLALEQVQADAAPILAELRRLHAIYGANHSFDRYATNLIGFAEYQTGDSDSPLTPEAARALQNGYELPLRVRVALGQALVDGGRLDADQALCWALAAPGSYLRTPGARCFKELCELWRIRFAQSHPEGMTVRLGKRHVEGQYRPASGGYTAEISFPKLPDVASLSTDRLRRMLDDCTTALDFYSRFLGRNPDLAGTVQAGALLPPELRLGEAGRALADASEKLAQTIGGGEGSRGGSTFGAIRIILGLSDFPAGEKIAAREIKDVADVLDAMDFGFEPDRRFGKVGPVFSDTPVVLFAAPGGGHLDGEGTAYAAARVMAEISALAAISDGVAVEEEIRSAARDLAHFGLSEAETSRLLALVHAILIDPPHSRAAMRRALELPKAERARIVDAAIGAVLADGKVLPAEVRFLEALHKTLGFDAEAVYSRLHRGAVEEELASVRPAIARSGSAIPEEERERAAIAIDEARLARIKQETTAVSALLSEIFVDDEKKLDVAQPADSAALGEYPGLDSAHSHLLDGLRNGAMPRADFDDLTRELKLMPAGAIETINDWAFEQFGEAILDDDDPVAIIEYLKDDVATARGQG